MKNIENLCGYDRKVLHSRIGYHIICGKEALVIFGITFYFYQVYDQGGYDHCGYGCVHQGRE